MIASPSSAPSAKVIPYEKPEQPPGVTYTRSARSARPCFAMISLSFSDALAVRLTTASLVPVSCGLVSIAKMVLLRVFRRSF